MTGVRTSGSGLHRNLRITVSLVLFPWTSGAPEGVNLRGPAEPVRGNRLEGVPDDTRRPTSRPRMIDEPTPSTTSFVGTCLVPSLYLGVLELTSSFVLKFPLTLTVPEDLLETLLTTPVCVSYTRGS